MTINNNQYMYIYIYMQYDMLGLTCANVDENSISVS